MRKNLLIIAVIAAFCLLIGGLTTSVLASGPLKRVTSSINYKTFEDMYEYCRYRIWGDEVNSIEEMPCYEYDYMDNYNDYDDINKSNEGEYNDRYQGGSGYNMDGWMMR